MKVKSKAATSIKDMAGVITYIMNAIFFLNQTRYILHNLS